MLLLRSHHRAGLVLEVRPTVAGHLDRSMRIGPFLQIGVTALFRADGILLLSVGHADACLLLENKVKLIVWEFVLCEGRDYANGSNELSQDAKGVDPTPFSKHARAIRGGHDHAVFNLGRAKVGQAPLGSAGRVSHGYGYGHERDIVAVHGANGIESFVIGWLVPRRAMQ